MAKLRLSSLRIVAALCVASLISISRTVLDTVMDDNDRNEDVSEVVPSTSFHQDDNPMQCLLPNKAIFTTKFKQSFDAGMTLCPRYQRPTADYVRTYSRWQRQQSINSTLVVYSAFYDDRPAVGVSSWIRLQGVASFATMNTTVYCHVWYDECRSPYVTEATSDVIGRDSGYVIDSVVYLQYVFSCRLPGFEPVPTHVSLVATDQCANSTMYVPIERPVRSEPDHEFGVCVAISFGSIPVTEFVEWIELHRMFGVTEFNIYDAGMENMSTVFEYYVRQGLLRVHPMPPPVVSQLSAAGKKMDLIKVSSTASLNDCLLRNVYRYRYVIVIDFDEVIVPRIHGNYSQMIQRLQAQHKFLDPVYQFKFVNTYFFKELEPDLTQPFHLRSMRSRRRVPPSTEWLAPKSFVDPRLCLVVHNHYCSLPFHGSPRVRLVGVTVSSAIARSHHYRKCRPTFSHQTCSHYYKSQTRDDEILRFKEQLQEAVEFVLTNIDYRFRTNVSSGAHTSSTTKLK